MKLLDLVDQQIARAALMRIVVSEHGLDVKPVDHYLDRLRKHRDAVKQ